MDRYSRKIGLSKTFRAILDSGSVARGVNIIAENEQVTMAFPYLDHNVIRICMRVPEYLKMNPYVLKPLLKEAFKNELPNELLNRNTKGDYTPDLYGGASEQVGWFKDRFKSMYLADMGLIDLKKYQEKISKLVLGVPVSL